MVLKKIKCWAELRGLVLGVAPVRLFEGGQRAFKWRSERKIATPFISSCSEKSCQPSMLYPTARSIIVIARPNLRSVSPSCPRQGIIANYALGKDYHHQLKSCLQELAVILKGKGAKLAVVQVDKGPLLEREAAYYAGLGYYGANCSLIVPGHGSYVTLGLLVTDLELEPGQPLEGAACDECGRCMVACPTNALRGPGRLDPRRCLSYLTQVRGIIPIESRSLMGQRIWGCDICQEVCPVNYHGQQQLSDPKEILSSANIGICTDLATIITMSNQDFRRTFGGTALAWRGKTVLQRNAVIALGNRGEAGAVKYLKQAALAPSAILRGHTAWALGRLGREGRLFLEKVRKRETDTYVRQEIDKALEAK